MHGIRGFRLEEFAFQRLDGLYQRMIGTSEKTDAWSGNSVKRFVVLKHEVGPGFERTTQTHLDWMFATGDALATWSTELIMDFEHSFDTPCMRLADHRLVYLDREGDLGGGRGSVRRMLAGEYIPLASALGQMVFKAALRWHTESGVQHGTLEIVQRREETVSESEVALGLRFSRCR